MSVYTDATGKGMMGYCIYDVQGNLLSWSILKRPLLCEALLSPRKNQVTAWETIAPLWACMQEAKRLQDQHVILFIDNVAAQFALSKGASKAADINSFCAAFWILLARFNIDTTIVRVPSKENPADGPSRGCQPPGCEDAMSFVHPVSVEDFFGQVNFCT